MMDEIEMTVPAEPPHQSVVLDHEDFAWQRFGGSWVRCGTPVIMWLASTKEPRADWVQLFAAGPVRVIWTPDGEGSDA
jgi:hypothetical protein